MEKIISQKKIAANRKNSLLSTGPKTSEGKKNSSKNALKHGFNARKFVIQDEQAKFFQAYHDEMLSILQPENIIEEEFAFQIVISGWKYRRYINLESNILKHKTKKKDNKLYIRWLEPGEKPDDENEAKDSNKNKDILPEELQKMGSLFKLAIMEQRQLNAFHKLLSAYSELKKNKIN